MNHLLTSVYYSDDDQGESIDSLYLYDLEDNSLVWSLDAIPGIVTNNFQFKGDFLFTLKDSLLWKYDFLNKEIIWEKRINQSTRIQTKILDNGIFFAETKSLGNKVTDLVKISIENGQELWRKPFNYPLNEVTFYQDFFYLIHKGVCQKRSVYSGEVVREFFNPEDLDMTGGSFDDAFGIDTITKNIYTADYSSALKYRNVD